MAAAKSDAAHLRLVPTPASTLLGAAAELELLVEHADDLQAHAVADSTRRYYEADFAQYQRWCARLSKQALPCEPETVRLYLTDLWLQMDREGLPRYRVSTIERHLAALSRRNYEQGYGRDLARHPRISAALQGMRNARQERVQRKRPLLLEDLRRLILDMDHDRWPRGVTAARDTFAFSLAFATAMRSEEIVGLRLGQVQLVAADGLWVTLGKSKTDQAGAGAVLPVPYGQHPMTCLPCSWVRWLRLLGEPDRAGRMRLVRQVPRDPEHWEHICDQEVPHLSTQAPLLRSVTKAGVISTRGLSTSGVSQALKRRLEATGYDPRPYGMHSWRAGMVTQARRNGASAREVRRQTRHTTEAMVDVYDREWVPLEHNAVRHLGL